MTTIKKEKKVEIPVDVNVEELQKKNESLQNDINLLKDMMEKLLNSQLQPKEEPKKIEVSKSSDEDSDRDYAIIPPNKLIKITSLYYGGMTLRGSNDKKIRFGKFGSTRAVSFDDLTYICTNHELLAEQGAFFIHDEEAVRALYLERTYENILDAKKIENLINLDADSIDEIMVSLTDMQKSTIEYVVIQGIIEGNNKYSNWTKIDTVGKHCNKNLRKIAQERMDDK